MQKELLIKVQDWQLNFNLCYHKFFREFSSKEIYKSKKHIMKRLFLITLLFANFGFYAQGQRGGNRGGRPHQNQNRQGGEQREIKEFKASDVAGIFYYDIKKVIKKIKVKDKETQNKVKKALKDYNFKVKEIAFLNSEKFNDLDEVMKTMKGAQRRLGNRNNDDYDLENPVTNKKEELEVKLKRLFVL